MIRRIKKRGSGDGKGSQTAGSKREQKKAVLREALGHAVRVRILGWLAGESRSRTQHEIGTALSLSNAAVHYHLKLLECAGLVKLKGTRPGPNSITEKLYSAVPAQWRRAAAMDDRDRSDFYLQYTVASIQEMHREAAELIKSDWEQSRFMVGCYETYAAEKDIKRLKNRLAAMLAGFHKRHRKGKRGSRPLAITFALLPSKAGGWRGTRRVLDMFT